MAGTKLSTKIGSITHRIIAVLTHAMLEWILMSLLLLNSLLYYSINRFAAFFRLKPICLWCTASFDRLTIPRTNNNSDESHHGDLTIFCEAHSALISELSYCANHKRLANSRNVCVDCVFSGLKSPTHCCQYASLCARIMKISDATTDGDDEEEDNNVVVDDENSLMQSHCSCCGKSWDGEFCSRPCEFRNQGSLDGATRKESFTCEEIGVPRDHIKSDEEYKLAVSGARRSIYLKEANEEATSDGVDGDTVEEDEFIQVDFVQCTTSSCDDDTKNRELCHTNVESLESMMNSSSPRNLSAGGISSKESHPALVLETKSDVGVGKLGDDNQTDDLLDEKETECIEVVEAETHAADEEVFSPSSSEWQTGCVITGNVNTDAQETPRINHSGEEQIGMLSSYSHDDETQANNESERSTLPVRSSTQSESGVVVVDPYLEIIQLSSDLESEKKARRELATELEAERSASAVATNQTMAMITRLQEEKSAIKTEALQYQRMMEEQAEYDQEALQLLNELVIKREKEKRGLEEQLAEMCSREERLLKENEATSDDEDQLLASCEVSGDVDEELVVGKSEYNEVEEESTGEVLSSVDNVLGRVKNWNMLDGSLEDFEEERTSILQQLKELEEKLYTLCDEDEFDKPPLEHNIIVDGKCVELGEENNDAIAIDLCSKEVNLQQISGGGCIVQSNSMALAAQKLLPMLESGQESASENNDISVVECYAQKQEIISVGVLPRDQLSMQDNMLAIVKEMDHVYGRLHALEADREFLRHCVSSLSKGDKGIDLLGEILTHLRELRAEENCGLLICQE